MFLHGSSTGRMVETVRIAMALVQGGLPVEIHGAEELMLRLLGMDNVASSRNTSSTIAPLRTLKKKTMFSIVPIFATCPITIGFARSSPGIR